MPQAYLNQHGDDKFHILAEVSRQITSILDIDELLVQVVRLIQKTFDYYHVGIGLVEGDDIVYRVGAGALWDDPAFRFKPQRLKIGSQGITGWVAQTGQAKLVPDVSLEPRYVVMQGSQTQSELIVPIIIREQTIGVLDLQSLQTDGFSGMDLELMQSLANQTGVAIQNARLYEGAKKLATIEERQRLARELHDSVTQALYGISLYAQAASALVAKGRIDKAEQYLDDIGITAQESLADMRLLIYELRPPLLEKEGLVVALQTRLYSVEDRAGIKTSLESNLAARLPLAIEEGLYRIASEALNNALKHAHPAKVRVSLLQNGAEVVLTIVDDGQGFDPDAPGNRGGLGLATMKERAQAQGWQLILSSRPGRGTSVQIAAEVKT